MLGDGGAAGGGIGADVDVNVVGASALHQGRSRADGASAFLHLTRALSGGGGGRPMLRRSPPPSRTAVTVGTTAPAIPGVLATALVLTVGAPGRRSSRWLAPDGDEAELCSARASRSCRRLEGVTLHPSVPLQMSASNAAAICSLVTPVGSGVTMAVVCTMTTSTTSLEPSTETADARLEARVATSREAAAAGVMVTTEAVV